MSRLGKRWGIGGLANSRLGDDLVIIPPLRIFLLCMHLESRPGTGNETLDPISTPPLAIRASPSLVRSLKNMAA